MALKSILIILSAIFMTGHSARILGLFTIPSYSHQIVYQAVYKELASRGHELVVLTTDPIRDVNLTNLREIDLSSSYVRKTFSFTALSKKSPLNSILEQLDIINGITEKQLEHPEVQDLIKNHNGDRFDLIIFEYVSPIMAVFREIYNCPIVGISSSGTLLTTYEAFGNPVHPVLNPDMFLPFYEDLTFWERLESVQYSILLRYFHYFHTLPKLNANIGALTGLNLNYYNIERNIDMLFLNINPIFTKPRPNGPAVIEFSSIHIKAKRPLPKNIKNYLDNCTQGAIYFSLGSNLQSKMLPETVKNNIMGAFSELPYNILWKFEDENLPGKPENVEIRKWLPQQDILGHPNIKLFITQGGLQSLEEAMYNKVPVLGLPFFSDQPQNIRKVKKLGIGLGLDIMKMSKDEFKNAIIEIIVNTKYATQMTTVSSLLQDQPMKSLDKIIWWIEYVIRNNGARHLRIPNADIEWWKFLMLDIFAFCSITFIITVYLAIKLIHYCIALSKQMQKLKIL